MRKWDVYKNLNRNSTMINHFHPNDDRRDVHASNIVMSQLWLQEDSTQVEIIELDSDDSEPEISEEQDLNLDNIWSYLDKERFSLSQPDYYDANKKAREKRRMHTRNYGDDLPETLEESTPPPPNDIVRFTSFYDFTNDLSVKNNARHPSNCFTIINKPFKTPESSSDEIEYKERLNTPDDLNNTDGEIVAFDEDNDSAPRTIWIYSFRNKRMLSDNDFELVNIPSQDSDSSTSCSLDNYTEERSSKNACRVSSPIPATYVPRLNLSLTPTLPTLTEITEPTTKADKETPNSDENISARKKCVNNWFFNEVFNLKKESDTEDKSSSADVVNWMCLSPRERRRRFKHTNAGPTYLPKLPVLAEVPSSEPISRNPLLENPSNQFQITAEINAVEHKPEEAQIQTAKSISKTCEINNVQSTTAAAITDESDNEKGFNLLHKPRLVISVDRSNKTNITDPMEKLNSNNWIHEETRKETNLIEVDDVESKIIEMNDTTHQTPVVEETADKKLWVRNMSLLKPVEWSEFMPITESIPSLHLSLDSDSRKQTWLTRLVKCFRCFK